MAGGDLPSGYTRLEYIEGQGAIVTDYIPTVNSSIFFDWQQTENGYISRYIHNYIDGSAKGVFEFYNMLDFGGKLLYEYHFYDYDPDRGRVSSGESIIFDSDTIITTPDTNRHTLMWSKEKRVVDNIDKVSWTPSGGYLTFLGRYDPLYPRNPAKAKMYGCKIWQDIENVSSLVCDYVPVQNSVGNQGVYDLINQKFYLYKLYNPFAFTCNESRTNCLVNELLGNVVMLCNYTWTITINLTYVPVSDITFTGSADSGDFIDGEYNPISYTGTGVIKAGEKTGTITITRNMVNGDLDFTCNVSVTTTHDDLYLYKLS